MTRGFYRTLLVLLPQSFREEYGEEMRRVADEHWLAVRTQLGWWGAIRFWVRQVMALLREAVRLRRQEKGTRGGLTMEGLAWDLRRAVRGLIRRPAFTLVTVATLGLGIGATTAIFSAVHTVLLRPLPYADADRLVTVFQTDVTTGERSDGVSAANIRDLDEAARRLSPVSVAEPWSLDLQVEGRAQSLTTWAVSEGFFEAIGVQAALGRTFLPEEYQEGAASVVLMSHGTWASRFGSDPGIVGMVLSLDQTPTTVVGVLPPEYRFPDAAELWMPRPTQPSDAQSRAADFMVGVARLTRGASLDQAQAEADRIAASLAEAYPDTNLKVGFRLVPLREHLFGDVRTPLLVIMAAAGFVLLIACANVAGLMLARGAQREREYALRGALGAGTGRLVAHVTAESVILAAVGCAVGVALTYGGVRVIPALGPDHLPRIGELRVDGTVLAFTGLAAALSAVLSGFAPSVRLSRPNLTDALSDGSRGSIGGVAAGRMRARLVVTEVAAAVVLLVGAGLLLRSFAVLIDKELGFDPTGRLAVQVFAYDYSTDGTGLDRGTFVNRVIEQMEAIPGVTGVGITTNLPSAMEGLVNSIEITVPFTIEDRAVPPRGQEPTVSISQVSPQYFDVMGIELVSGRAFDPTDDSDAQPVVIVNEALARRHFGGDPLGESIVIQFGPERAAREIVGVIGDTRALGHASEPVPMAMMPLSQLPSGSLTFVLRAATDAASLTGPAAEAVWAVNPSQSVWGAATVESLVSEWLKERRFTFFLLSSFSVVALLLAAVGVYGLISFSVQRRLGEFGIRRALGGQSRDLMAMVVLEGGEPSSPARAS